jgi:hypothetical protein
MVSHRFIAPHLPTEAFRRCEAPDNFVYTADIVHLRSWYHKNAGESMRRFAGSPEAHTKTDQEDWRKDPDIKAPTVPPACGVSHLTRKGWTAAIPVVQELVPANRVLGTAHHNRILDMGIF